jgi:hypothetical protein
MWWVPNEKWLRLLTPTETALVVSCSLGVGVLVGMLVWLVRTTFG